MNTEDMPQIIINPPIELSQLPESIQAAILNAIRQNNESSVSTERNGSYPNPAERSEVEPQIIEVPRNFTFKKETEEMDFTSLQQSFSQMENKEIPIESMSGVENDEVIHIDEQLLLEDSMEEKNEGKFNENNNSTANVTGTTSNSDLKQMATSSMSQLDQQNNLSNIDELWSLHNSPENANENLKVPEITSARIPIIRIKRHTRKNPLNNINNEIIPPPNMETSTPKYTRNLRPQRKHWKKPQTYQSTSVGTKTSKAVKKEETSAPNELMIQDVNTYVNTDTTMSSISKAVVNIENVVNDDSAAITNNKNASKEHKKPTKRDRKISTIKKPRTTGRRQPTLFLKRKIVTIIRKAVKEMLKDVSQLFENSSINIT